MKIIDYSCLLNKTFVVTKNMKNFNKRPLLKDTKFKIKKIETLIGGTEITIKIINKSSELEKIGMFKYDFNRMIKNTKEEIKIFEKILKMWKDKYLFVIDYEESYKGKKHYVNTGYYKIPKNHPNKGNKFSDDVILTYTYKRTDNVKNIYSYQTNKNEFYSQECYKYMLEGKKEDLKNLKLECSEYKKMICGWLTCSFKVSPEKLNKVSFKML